MKEKDIMSITYNDSDVGYLDFNDCFVEEVKKEIKETLLTLNNEIKEDCASCDLEYQDKKGSFVCNTCGKVINT